MRARALGIGAFSLVVVLIAAGAFVWHRQWPTSLAGMAAKTVCGGVYIAGRPLGDVIEHDLLPISVLMHLVQIGSDEDQNRIQAGLPGSPDRHALFSPERGCVLLAPGAVPESHPLTLKSAGRDDPAGRPGRSVNPNIDDGRPWPQGATMIAAEQWPARVNRAALEHAIATVFANPNASSVSPTTAPAAGPNSRAVLVVHKGQLIAERFAEGFDARTPQLGWSMAKTVTGALAWARFQELSIDFRSPVVDLLTRVPQPKWAGEWRRDARARITLDHLFTMHDGLAIDTDSYSPFTDLPRMLWAIENTGEFAAQRTLAAPPGTHWRYASAVTNLLSRVLRDQFSSDDAYISYAREQLFEPIGARSAMFESDANGNIIGSSYLWASPHDWLRIGWLLLNDGRWQDHQIFPAGWLDYVSARRRNASGDVGPYGAQVWLTHNDHSLGCRNPSALPSDGLLLTGARGQLMALFPTTQTVILRLAWTTTGAGFDQCEFLSEILASIRD